MRPAVDVGKRKVSTLREQSALMSQSTQKAFLNPSTSSWLGTANGQIGVHVPIVAREGPNVRSIFGFAASQHHRHPEVLNYLCNKFHTGGNSTFRLLAK